jgi:histone H3/H4
MTKTKQATSKKGSHVKKVGKRRTIKAGLQVPVPAARRFIRLNYPSRVSADAEIALAACLEAIMTPIILGAADEAGAKSTLLANDVEAARLNNPWTRHLIPGGVGAVFVKRE